MLKGGPYPLDNFGLRLWIMVLSFSMSPVCHELEMIISCREELRRLLTTNTKSYFKPSCHDPLTVHGKICKHVDDWEICDGRRARMSKRRLHLYPRFKILLSMRDVDTK